MIYSSKYEYILKMLLLYLVDGRYGGMLSRFDFLIRDRLFFLVGHGGGLFFSQLKLDFSRQSESFFCNHKSFFYNCYLGPLRKYTFRSSSKYISDQH